MPVASFADIVEDDAPANVASLDDIVDVVPASAHTPFGEFPVLSPDAAPTPAQQKQLASFILSSGFAMAPASPIAIDDAAQDVIANAPATRTRAKPRVEDLLRLPSSVPIPSPPPVVAAVNTPSLPARPMPMGGRAAALTGVAPPVPPDQGVAGDLAALPVVGAPLRGGREIVAGLRQAAATKGDNAEAWKETAGGLSRAIRGGFTALEPAMVGSALARPIATAVTIGSAAVAQKVTELAGAALNVDPRLTGFAADLAAIAAGAGAAHGAGKAKQLVDELRPLVDADVAAAKAAAETLGVSVTATPAEIQAAYRAAAKKYHPDVNPNVDASKMADINLAAQWMLDHPWPALPGERGARNAASTVKTWASDTAAWLRSIAKRAAPAPEPGIGERILPAADQPTGTANLADIVAVAPPTEPGATELGIPGPVSADPVAAVVAAKAAVTELVDQLPKGSDAAQPPIAESTQLAQPAPAAATPAAAPTSAAVPEVPAAPAQSGVAKLEDIVEVAPPAAPGVTLEAPDGQARPAAAPEIQTGDGAARPGPAPEGQAVAGGDRRSAEGPRLSKTRQRESDLLDEVIADATTRGFTGDPAVLRGELLKHAQAMREIKAEVDAAGGTGNALVRELVKAGGLAIKAETGMQGELRWLKESGLGKRWGLFTSKRKGLTLDGAVEHLRQDPRFQHIEDINDLVDELTDVAQSETSLGDLTARELGAVGERWWEHFVPSEAPAAGVAHVDDIVDVVDTGEEQPRLPEAGAVRETEVRGPEFEAPFSLTGEAHDAGSVQEGLGFEAPQTPAPDAARVTIKAGAYRGVDGFKIFGRDAKGRHVSIFADTRAAAEHIRDKVRRGEEIGTDDFQPRSGGRREASVGSVGPNAPGRPAPIPKPDDRRLFPSAPAGTATSAHPVHFPELVDLARQLQHVPKIKKSLGQAFGVFRHARGIDLLAGLFKSGNEHQVAATLAHEIGHLVDYLPHKTLKRGNLLGRLFSMRDFLKGTFTADNGNIIENAVIRAELKALSDKWRPWDEAKASASFRKYRNSGKEQYADALSVLLNDPALLKKDAPTFYTEFFNALDRKPEVRDAYFALQEVLSGTPEELVARRRAGVRRMFEEGDVKALELEQRRLAELKQAGKDLWFRMKTQLVDRNYAVIDRVNNLPAGVRLADDENPIYLLEERNYMGAQLKAFAEKNFAPVFSEVSKADIPWNAFGEALMYERIIAGDRSELANPRGLSPETVPALLAALKQELGAERVKVLDVQLEKFRAPIKKAAEAAYQEGLYTDELHEQMQQNPAYVTFQVTEHLESGVTSKVYRQIGTLKDIVNPADASILKTLMTIRATEHQKVKRSVFGFLEQHYPTDIKPAKTVWSGKGHRPIESKDPNERLVTYFEKGKLVGKYVDPYIADALERATIGQNLAVVSILRTINSGVFRPLFTTFNLGFQGFNAARDFERFWKNVPTMTVGRALLRYHQAVPLARARAFGLPAHPTKAQLDAYRTLLDAEEAKILGVTFNDLINGRQVEDTQIEDILARTGVGGFKMPERSKWVKPLLKVLDTIRETGDFIETLPKAAAIYEFKGSGSLSALTAEQRSYIRRKVGSPDFLTKGTFTPVTNEVFLFSNAITQAVRSDLEVATDFIPMEERRDENGATKWIPKTRSGFWWKTAKANLLPKLLLAAGLAGLFGEALKRMLGRVSEYDRTNYIIVPLGEDDKGNTIYLRMPQDDSGRLVGGLFWKVLRLARGETDTVETVAQVADYSAGQFPNVAPSLQTIGAALQFAAGQNPYDAFRGRNVFTEDEWKARDWRTAKKFVGWEFQQLGGGIVWKFYPGEPRPQELTKGQKILELPLVSNIAGRFLRITNYGETETFRKAAADVAKGEARARMDERAAVNDAIRTYQQLPTAERSAGRRWQLARQVADKVYADESASERGRRTNLIVKKLSLGLVRGEADPLADSVLAATSNDQKVAVLREARKRMGETAFTAWLKDALQHDVVSVNVRNALRRPTVEEGLRRPAPAPERVP